MRYTILFPAFVAAAVCGNAAEAVPEQKSAQTELSKKYEAANAIFMPQKSVFSETPVPVRSNRSLFFDAKIMGIPCAMLLDTGASHTVFDMDFIKKHFPKTTFFAAVPDPESNVKAASFPIFDVGELAVGGNVFSGFKAVGFDLSPLKRALWHEKELNGVLGMNVITQRPVLISYSTRTIRWITAENLKTDYPGKIEIPAVMDPLSGCFSLVLTSPDGKKTAQVLLDSGASNSYFPKDFWPAEKIEQHDIITTTANKHGVREQISLGGPATLSFGKNFSLTNVRPTLADEKNPHISILGDDVLSRFDVIVDRQGGKVYALPHKK